MARTLRPPKAPNLPVGPVEYNQQYQNLLNGILRLYYNEIDNSVGVLMENSGGRFISFPHVYASSNATQYATGDNTPTQISWTTLVREEGFTLNTTTGSATPTYSGSYRVEYRLQAENTDTAAHNVYLWISVDNVNVPNAGAKFTVPANTGSDSYTVCYSFIQVDMNGGSEIKLYWATDKAATSGGGLGVYLEAYPAQTSPFAVPAIPSAYGSITFVSELSQ